MIKPAYEILNQRGTPMFFSDVFANRPDAGIVGRIFISTDTFAFYRDNGVTWDLIGGPGTGTITGSGTAFKYAVFTATQEIGNGSIEQFTTTNKSTKDFVIDSGIALSQLTINSTADSLIKLSNDTDYWEIKLQEVFGESGNSLIFEKNDTGVISCFMDGNNIGFEGITTFSSPNNNDGLNYFAVDPNLLISATGLTNGATITLKASDGAYYGTIRTGYATNSLRFQTGNNVDRLIISNTGTIQISNLGGSGNRMVVVDNTGLLSQQAIPTIFGSLAAGQVAFGSASNTIAGNSNFLFDNANNRFNFYPAFLGGVKNFNIYTSALFQETAGDDNKIYIGSNTSTNDCRLVITPFVIRLHNTAGTLQILADNLDLGAKILLNTRNTDAGSMTLNAGGITALKIFGATRNIAIQNGGTYNDTGERVQIFGGNVIITASTNTLPLNIAGYTLTGSNSNSGFSLTGTWNTTASPIAIALNITNTASAITSLLINLSVDSVSRFSVDRIGRTNISNTLTAAGIISNVAGATTAFFTSRGSGTTGTSFLVTGGGGVSSSGDLYVVNLQSGISPTSGTATHTHIYVQGVINQTGGANGITRGLYIQPTLTSAADWRSIETANNTGYAAYFGGSADLFFNDATDLQFGTTTGTKIGTATTQKIGLWNATPIVQPTTAVGSATFNSPGGGSAIKTDDTFDGYTLQQVVKALRDIGILA